ncbi:MAG: hypothetical protein EPN22_06520 [Nitrospirae bacterium]|nr:MAG: hypothetical protein EPN22_06520 [Nitrospirota bacterium]
MKSSERSAPRIITLTTDFGTKDSFVAEMKGVILSINPQAVIVDVTHEVRPHAIDEGAFVLASAVRYFPKGTIHIAVVDPGVGSCRRGILVKAGDHFFVGPDNGIFSLVLSKSDDFRAFHITNEKFVFDLKSPTFQGRDVFAPVAACFSKGLPCEEFGKEISDLVLFEAPKPEVSGDTISGRVIFIDRFGNVITNMTPECLVGFEGRGTVTVNNVCAEKAECYAMSAEDRLSFLFNSSGNLELFVKSKSAADMYGIRRGDPVVVRIDKG